MLGVCLKYEQFNYGSKLQAWATVQTLERMGLSYEILRYNKRTPGFVLKSLLRLGNFCFLCDRYDQLQRRIAFRLHPGIREQVGRRNGRFLAFDARFQSRLSRVYPSYGKLKQACPKRYDVLLTCSDQLWSPSALGSGFYNLMFAPESMPKISWASSFGVSRIPWYQRSRTRNYLNRIQHITMREDRGAEIVRELTGREVPVLMDPVFLYDCRQWDAWFPPEKTEWDSYIFCYFLGDHPAHRATARAFSAKTGMPIVTLRHLDRFVAADEGFGDAAPYEVGPEEFLNLLRNAACICTDSFHGCAFSLIYGKPFAVFDRYAGDSANSKNSRIESLCRSLHLETRRVWDGESLERAMDSPIDYEAVEEKLEKFRSQTREYLTETLGEATHGID